MAITANRINCPKCGAKVLVTYTASPPRRKILVDELQRMFAVIFNGKYATQLQGYQLHDQTCPGKEVNNQELRDVRDCL
jgi:hypothetical protein